MKFKIGKYEVEELYTEDVAEQAVAEQIEDEKTREQLLTILTNRNKNMLRYVISQNEELVGVITFSGESTATPEIGIKIVEQYRNKGIGYLLLTNLMERVEKVKRVSCFIYRVRNDNPASIRLVEKLGGELVKRYKPMPQFDLEFITYHVNLR